MHKLLSLLAVVVSVGMFSPPKALPRQAPDSASPTKDPGWKLGHTRDVRDVTYSQDGKRIASAGDDGSVRLWNAENGALLQTFVGDAEQGFAVRFSPDDRYLASGGGDKQVRIWSLPQGRLIHTLSGHRASVHQVAWSLDGTLLASGGEGGQVILWNLTTGKHRALPTAVPVVDTLAFSRDGKTLTVSGGAKRIRHILVRSDRQGAFCDSMAEEPRQVALYDCRTGKRRQNWLTKAGFTDMAFSPDGSLVAIYAPNPKSMAGVTTIRDASTSRVLRKLLAATTNRPPHILFSSNNKTFLASDAQATVGGEIGQVWNLAQTAPKTAKFKLDFNVLAISPDGGSFAAQDPSQENRVAVYDTRTRRERWASADPLLILGSKPTLAVLNQLCEDYRAYNLPALPKTAYLAYMEAPVLVFEEPARRHLVFIVPPDHPGEPTYYYNGLNDEIAGNRTAEATIRAVTSDQVPLQDNTDKATGWSAFNTDTVTAIRMQVQGWTPLALAYLKRALTDYRGDARRDLAETAWRYWEATISATDGSFQSVPKVLAPNTDRQAAVVAMRVLLHTGLLEQTENSSRSTLLADLEVTAAPSHTAPGSVEAEIDALVEYDEKDVRISFGEPTDRPLLSRADPRYKKLWMRGFEAAPFLLKHTQDRRFTRTKVLGSLISTGYRVRISQVVADLLTGLAGSEEAVGVHQNREGSGKFVDPAKAERWWQQAHTLGEETYLLQHVLPEANNERSRLNDHNATLIAVKYPRHLPALYREMLNRYPHAKSGQFAQLLQESQLPDADKTALLTQGTAADDGQQRVEAFRQLAAMKRPGTASLLIDRLNRLPATPPGKYKNCEAAGLTPIVQALDDPPAWEALERLAQRSDVGQRLEILSRIINPSASAEQKRRQIAFLAKFVSDQTLRVVPKEKFVDGWPTRGKYDGLFADFDKERITVQDSVLRHVSFWIGVKERPDSGWTKAQWDTWRQTSLQALHTYLAQVQ